jgi:hypothetical protein
MQARALWRCGRIATLQGWPHRERELIGALSGAMQ